MSATLAAEPLSWLELYHQLRDRFHRDLIALGLKPCQIETPPALIKLGDRGGRVNRLWSEEDDTTLRQLYNAKIGMLTISARLQRSPHAVRVRIYRLHLREAEG